MESSNHLDLISELPDELLLNIFSFLDETVVIQSSVLSKRWRYLWTLVPFPEDVKQRRYHFKTQKIYIREEKFVLEKIAKNTVSMLSIDVAKSIGLYCLHALLITMLELPTFGVIHFFLTLVNMLHIYFSCWSCHSRLKCFDEASVKKLQERDSRLTVAANSYSTCSKLPIMEFLFPDDFQPRYAETAKLYGLFGVLLLMIISSVVIVLRWKIEFIPGRGGSESTLLCYLSFFSFLIHLGYLLYLWSSILLQYFLDNRLISSFY